MMMDGRKQLLAWFVGHFWGRCAAALAGLALLGFLLGLCRLPSWHRHDVPVLVADLNRSPEKYEAASVCVRGTVLDLRVEDNKLVRPYAVFSLQETSSDGSYDFINIISLRLPSLEKGSEVRACGFFNKIKQIGKDTYYNSILLNRLEEETAPPK
jgi:hypothetical protein